MLSNEASINFKKIAAKQIIATDRIQALFERCLFFEEIYASLQRILVP